MLWIQSAFEAHANREFLETPQGTVLSYAEMREQVIRQAAALRQLGVTPGDRVLAQIEKSPEGLALYFGCLWIGAVFVPLNTAYTSAELEYFLKDAEPRVAVLRPEDADSLAPLLRAAGVKQFLTLSPHQEGTLLEQVNHITEADLPPAFDGGPGHPAAILYTSGTTGRSKGAILTHGNLVSNAAALADLWRFTAEDVLIHTLPAFHVHGLFVAVHTTLLSGAKLLFLPRFDPVEVLNLFSRATVLMGVPTYYTRLLQQPGLAREATGQMRLFISGSAPLLAETHHEFTSRTGHAILERYGMTETLINTSNPYDGPRIPGTVGHPIPGVQLRITDPGTGVPFDHPDAVGMIEVRGPNVFQGYWRNPEKTAAEFRLDGFFITGDLGKQDSLGNVTLVGRGKDLIITGGYNVYPKEVETELNALPGVVESAVIGVPHPDLGEGVTAVVVKKPDSTLTETELLLALSGRLARFKLPKKVLWVPELPRNTMGKVQKNVLRDLHRNLYA